MASRPRIGVTGNGKPWAPSWWCTWAALRWIGAQPVRISVRHQPEDEENLDGLIIGGGDDIGPEQYGGSSDVLVKSDPARDRLERRWIRYALRRNWPLLGICRGAQLINVEHGGTLHQNIRPLRKHTSNRASLIPTKQVSVDADSGLARLSGKTCLRVNSLHQQAVDVPGKGLRIVAEDRDGICQGIERGAGPAALGVQWHPEYLLYLPVQMRLFRWLLSRVDQGARQGDKTSRV